tara:strand:- start:774 stop:1106 length:333 start_codon:yes stop_codon:yes gene_type:complete
MANAFKNKGTSSISTSNTTIYNCPSSTTSTVIGLTMANTTSSSITVSIKVHDNSAGASYFIVKDAPVLAGGSLVVVGGDQKIVLEASDYIFGYSSASSSADAFVSVLEQT